MPNSTFQFQGDEYSFSPERDIGILELRHIKSWYGMPLGSYRGLTAAAAMGDPDALSCVIWVAMRKAANGRLIEPHRLPDFSIGQFMGSFVTDGESVHVPFPPCTFVVDGSQYEFHIDEQLTRDTLKRIKDWFPDIGTLISFVIALFQGDPDALACAVWIMRVDAGEENVPDPRDMDFAVGEVLDSYNVEIPLVTDPEPPADPRPKGDNDEPETLDPPQQSDGVESSTEIPMIFGGSTMQPSPTPSTLARKKRNAVRS